jgi:3-methyladenine DNA glycosylase Mpg
MNKSFYNRNPKSVAQYLLGKVIVRDLDQGIMAAMLTGTEMIPIFDYDLVPSGVPGSFMILGSTKGKQSLAVIAGYRRLKRLIVLRQANPLYGIEKMQDNFPGIAYNQKDLTRYPSSLFKSFGISKSNLNTIRITDWNLELKNSKVIEIYRRRSNRLGYTYS